jgi:hypothetical protein
LVLQLSRGHQVATQFFRQLHPLVAVVVVRGLARRQTMDLLVAQAVVVRLLMELEPPEQQIKVLLAQTDQAQTPEVEAAAVVVHPQQV